MSAIAKAREILSKQGDSEEEKGKQAVHRFLMDDLLTIAAIKDKAVRNHLYLEYYNEAINSNPLIIEVINNFNTKCFCRVASFCILASA